MKLNSYRRIAKSLKKHLDDDRFEHTLGVTYTAASLAMRYEYDIHKAQLAGLLHDCAKCIPNDKKLLLCEKHNINLTDVEKRNPFLIHAKLGAFLAMHKYHIADMELINSILNHTTGRPAMSMLDKIIYIADYIEPNRNQAPELSRIRKLAFLDIDEALYAILKNTLAYLEATGGEIDPMTCKAYDYYHKKNEEKRESKGGEI